MAIKFSDDVFKNASDQAKQNALIETAEARLKAMGTNAYGDILDKLKSDCVDHTLIEELEKEINAATDKNKLILDLIRKGGKLGKLLLGVIGKI